MFTLPQIGRSRHSHPTLLAISHGPSPASTLPTTPEMPAMRTRSAHAGMMLANLWSQTRSMASFSELRTLAGGDGLPCRRPWQTGCS